MKARNKSRLTKVDLNKVCEMQHSIDRLESFILAIYFDLIKGQNVPIIKEDNNDISEGLTQLILKHIDDTRNGNK
jgi:hypothetical protein